MNKNTLCCRLALCMMLLCAGCLFGCVRSVYPILKDEQVIHSNALAGVWDMQVQKTGEQKKVRLFPESEIPPRQLSEHVPEYDPHSNRYIVPKGGYRVVVSKDLDPDGKFDVLNVRLGNIGSMSIAEFTAPLTHMDDDGLGRPDDFMFLPMYGFARVDIVSDDHLRIWPANLTWFAKYLSEHPDELEVLSADPNSLTLSAKTDSLQAFLLKHADEKELWMQEPVELVRSSDPATKPAGASTQPADATTLPARTLREGY